MKRFHYGELKALQDAYLAIRENPQHKLLFFMMERVAAGESFLSVLADYGYVKETATFMQRFKRMFGYLRFKIRMGQYAKDVAKNIAASNALKDRMRAHGIDV